MATYKTPGVYIEEISAFPPSVAAVATAIPAFIGYTEKATDTDGTSLTNQPKRIASLQEFGQLFGGVNSQALAVNVTQSAAGINVTFNTAPGLPAYFLYYSMKLFFANGGGPCYIVSVGNYPAPADPADLTGAITTLEQFDEPTLLVFPDACLLTDVQHGTVMSAALLHCSKMQDRFMIADVRNAIPGGTDDIADIDANFRANVPSGVNLAKYGAAYAPYVNTTLPWESDEPDITITTHTVNGTAGGPAEGQTLDTVATSHTAIYNAVKAFVNSSFVTVPPSGAIAGIYARTDNTRGVWKAPANTSILNVVEPALKITNDFNDGLNIDATSGKSVNAIRKFTGKGTLVWGARTLAGNDNEWRYVPVRRTAIFIEESLQKATGFFVFEPNDANTWVKVRSMIEAFLTRLWRDGALAGEKPEDAFYVKVGLNLTMTPQDILDGYMIIQVGLAIVRPAEFIVLQIIQKLQES